jgi:hypothetical protein
VRHSTYYLSTSLFGRKRGWFLPWIVIDDSIRGGISKSYLEPQGTFVKFHGDLDTKTLKGAGFCSVKHTFKNPENMSKYKGLKVLLSEFDGKKYSINLSDKSTFDNKSMVSYKISFKADKIAHVLLFKDFKPYFRGRPVLDPVALDWNSVNSVSLMMQSFFDKQSGHFEIVIDSINYV